jgi:hypothetical protein
MPRRQIEQTAPLEDRLSQKAQRLRQEAGEAPAGVDRARLLRQARQVETAAELSNWLRPSAGKRYEMTAAPEQSYRLYTIGNDNQLTGRIEMACQDDEAAKLLARQMVNGRAAELWCGTRMVAVLKPRS